MKLLLTATLALTFILILSFCLYCITKEEIWEAICDVLTGCIIVVASTTLAVWIVWR